MKNSRYWEDRQAMDMWRYMEKAERAADQIASLYIRTTRYLENASIDIFEKYQTKHNLTDADARRLLNALQDKTSLDEMLERLHSATDSKERQELLSKIEAPAYQARLERLRQLQNQVDIMMHSVYNQEVETNTQFYTELANESYYRNIYNIQQRANVAFSFNFLNQEQIDKVLHSKWSGENYSSRIWKNTTALANSIKEELLFNLMTGRTNREAAQVIEEKFASGASAARRLVRTESNFLATEMNLRAYKETGIERYKFLATLDLLTSKICQSLDGMTFLIEDAKHGLNCPPMHPWCRSTIVAVTKFSSKGTRFARDPVTGRGIKVPVGMHYDEWYKKFVLDSPEYKEKVQWEKFDSKYMASNKEELLPKRKKAIIADEKITGYALNKEHANGKNKAIAFEKHLGYNVNNKELLLKEVKRGLGKYKANQRKDTNHGTPYDVRMKVKGANGNYAKVAVGWLMEHGSEVPRLVTIYVDE